MTEAQNTFSDSAHQHILDPFNISDLPSPLISYAKVIITSRTHPQRDYIYLLGGFDGHNALNTVYRAIINDDGKLGEWVITDPLPKPLFSSKFIILKNNIYLIGGVTENSLTDNIYMTYILRDGTLGKWINIDPLPLKLVGHEVIATDKYVYVLGGITYDGTVKNYDDLNRLLRNVSLNIYRAKINCDGSFDLWEEHGFLPGFLSFFKAIKIKNRIYLLGGHNGPHVWSGIYTAEIDNEGNLGKWTTSSPLPEPSYIRDLTIIDDRIYLLSEYEVKNNLKTVYTAPIDSNGVIGKWEKKIFTSIIV